MKEEYLHYLWKYGLFDFDNLKSTQGEKVEILRKGHHNTNAGPDFLNAQIRIGETIWAGNVEIHIKSSDWNNHGHQTDPAYDNVILHVVLHDNKEIFNSKGQAFSTLSLSNRIDFNHFSLYQKLISQVAKIPCSNRISQVDEFKILKMKERMIINRLERKTDDILDHLERTEKDLATVFYQTLASNFGFKINAQAFEELAKRLSLKTIQKHIDNPLQVEALLFGTAGFFDQAFQDDYPKKLAKEYSFLKSKYDLVPMKKLVWKYARLRPANFPSIRIAQFASFLIKNRGLLNLDSNKEITEWRKMFELVPHAYWNDHTNFDRSSKFRNKRLGEGSIDNILINSVSRFSFVQARRNQDFEKQERSLDFLMRIDPEKNSIIHQWKNLGVECKNAYDSQALIELKNEWCSNKRCLNCTIGVSLMEYESV